MGVQVTKKETGTKAATAKAKAVGLVEVYLAHGLKHRLGAVLFEKGIVYQVTEDAAEHLFGIVISDEQKFEQAGIKQKELPRKAVLNLNVGKLPAGITVPDDDEVTAHLAQAHTGEADTTKGDGGGQDDDTEGSVSV